MKKNTPPSRRQNTPSARKLAWHCLCRWGLSNGEFADSLIRKAEGGLRSEDRALLQSIVLATLRNLRLLKFLLAELRGNRHTQEDAEWLLLCGLCQLFILHYPEYAVVNESVKLAPQRLKPLVNGILREALRRREQWVADLPKLPVAVRCSVPDWLAVRWVARFGAEEGSRLLELMQQPSQVFLRINAINPPECIPPNWQPLPDLPGWFCVTNGGLPVEAIRAGHVYIADPSTRHSVDLLAPAPGELILDACAAPGGKSCAILSATQAMCRLVATDNAESRLPLLRRNLERSAPGADFRVQLCDWSVSCPSAWLHAFDAVLADVPCSNSGVLRRRVDVRWRLSPDVFAQLTDLQLRIAQNAMLAVKPGGRLVYSTCSIEPEENGDLVRRLLTLNPDWHLEREVLVLPQQSQSDGAYAALITTGPK